MRSLLAAAILLTLAGISFAQSQPPSPSGGQNVQEPTPQATQPNNNPANNQRGSEKAPLVVKILPPENAAQQPASKPAEHDQEAANNERIARFTERLFWATGALAAIAGLQLFVFGWQGIQLRSAVAASKDEYLAAHRPKIRLKHFVLKTDIWQNEPIIVDLTIVNNGTSDAYLGQIGVRYHVIKTNARLPIEPNITHFVDYGWQTKLEPGPNCPISGVNIGRVLTNQENADIQQGRARLFCVRYIGYRDGAKRRRITGFCRVLKFPPNSIARVDNSRFRRFPDPDYEYED